MSRFSNLATGRLRVESTLGYSGLTASAPSSAAVTNSSGQVVASNTSRKGLVIINVGAANVSLAFGGNAAVVNSGITLVPNGVYEADQNIFVTDAVNAVSPSSSTIAIQEFT